MKKKINIKRPTTLIDILSNAGEDFEKKDVDYNTDYDCETEFAVGNLSWAEYFSDEAEEDGC